MQGKSWKVWVTALKVAFTTDGSSFTNPLGNWIEQTKDSQKWTTYRDIKNSTLYRSPTKTIKTWTAHEPVKTQGRNITYNNELGRPCTPPHVGVNTSLQYKTRQTLIYNNSHTMPVLLRKQLYNLPDSSTKNALTLIDNRLTPRINRG